MRYELRIGGKSAVVELSCGEAPGSPWLFALDGQPLQADAVELAPGIFSILLDGRSHEVRVTPQPGGTLRILSGLDEFSTEILDPRSWRGRRHDAAEAEGRQPVAAPMPGKVVRILAQPGESVEAGQGILVVEAMKMQNEMQSPKAGKLVQLLVRDGQAVNAGDILAWIE